MNINPGFFLGTYDIEYLDGRQEKVRSNFWGLGEVEKRWPDMSARPIPLALGYAVWCYLDQPGGDWDEWMKSVHNIALSEDAEDEVLEAVPVPTEAVRGAA